MPRIRNGLPIALTAALVLGCTETQRGAGIGAGVGAGVGAIIGNQNNEAGEGAVIGAAVGAVAGAIIGHERQQRMDKEEAAREERAEAQEAARELDSEAEFIDDDTAADEVILAADAHEHADADQSAHEGRQWVEGHYETRQVPGAGGRMYEREVWVPGHYE